MTGSTVPDGFVYEENNDVPAVTLRREATGETLAEQVQAKFVTADASISDLTARVSALEDGTGGVGWIPISTGNTSGDDFTLDLTAGGKFPDPPLWNVIKVFMRADLDAAGYVECRINGDSDAVYRSSGLPFDGQGNVDSQDSWYFDTGLAWRIGHLSSVSTGTLEMTIFNADSNPGLFGFQCTSGRESDDDSAHRYTIAHGSTIATKTISSLFFQPSAGAASFVNAWWDVAGLRVGS